MVVNNCTDRTARDREPVPGHASSRCSDNPDKKSGAMNHGWQQHGSGGDLVLTMDADTVLLPDTVATMAEELRGNPMLGAVCARYWADPGRGPGLAAPAARVRRYDDLRELRGWRSRRERRRRHVPAARPSEVAAPAASRSRGTARR